MPRFDRRASRHNGGDMAGAQKFTPEQREALAGLVLDHGLSVHEAVARAAHGIEGVEPFEMLMSTAYDVIAQERQRHEEALDRFVEHSYELLDRELTELEDQQRRGEGLDCVRLGRLARAATHVGRAARYRAAAKPAADERKPSALVPRLTEAHQSTANGAATRHHLRSTSRPRPTARGRYVALPEQPGGQTLVMPQSWLQANGHSDESQR